jgi:undecaprenyl-diphosphatase
MQDLVGAGVESVPSSSPPRQVSSGWLLSLLLVGIATIGVTYLADAAGEHDGVSAVDPVIAADVLHTRTPLLTAVARGLSFVGSELVVGLLAVAVLALLVTRRKWSEGAIFAIAMGGSAFLTVAVKELVARSRPGQMDRLGAFDPTYSFPSGHTLNSAVFLAVTVWLLWRNLADPARVAIALGAAILATGIGASRVYLGYHWLTDVVASVLVAAGWLAAVWLVHEPVSRSLTRLTAAPAGRSGRRHRPSRRPS